MSEFTELDENLRLFISAWMWFVLSIIFLSFTMLFFLVRFASFWIPFLVIFAFCLFKSFKRREERLEKEQVSSCSKP